MSIDDAFNKKLRTEKDDLTTAKANKITFISFNDLVQSKINKNIFIVDDKLKGAISEDGLLNALMVKRVDNGKYEIISGNRRYEAFKAILANNKGFKYSFASNKQLDPIVDGIPCVICDRDLNEDEEKKLTIEHNKTRDFDKLEIYNAVKEAINLYGKLKAENNEIIEGRCREWVSNLVSVSMTTISTIMADKWLINSDNIKAVKKAGSYEDFISESEEKPNKPQKTLYQKEEDKLKGLIKAYENKVIDKNEIDTNQLNTLQDYATKSIAKIMKTYELNLDQVKLAFKNNA